MIDAFGLKIVDAVNFLQRAWIKTNQDQLDAVLWNMLALWVQLVFTPYSFCLHVFVKVFTRFCKSLYKNFKKSYFRNL